MSEQELVRDEIPEPSMVEPGEVQYLTEWQIEENKKCFDKVNGPLYFLGHYCYVNCGKMIKFELRPYTTELIYCIHNFDRFLGMLGRQMGKTTTCCLYALWLAMFSKDQQVLLTSYNYDQTVLKNMATIKTAYEYCPKWLKEPVLVWNESRIKFASGSEIIAKTTTEDCVRGTSPNLIYADELAWTFKGSSTSQLAFYTSVFPALSASKGKLAITSTPQSSMDLFGTTWENANKFDDDDGKPLPCVYVLRDENNAITDLTLFTNKEDAEKYNNEHPELNSKVYERHGKGYNDFVSYRAIWADVPGRTESWKQSQIKVLGEQMFLREYECLSGEEVVSIRLPSGEIRNVTLKNLYQYYNINLN